MKIIEKQAKLRGLLKKYDKTLSGAFPNATGKENVIRMMTALFNNEDHGVCADCDLYEICEARYKFPLGHTPARDNFDANNSYCSEFEPKETP